MAASIRKSNNGSGLQRSARTCSRFDDRDWDHPPSSGQGYRSICGGLRAFLRFQVLSALPAVSLIIPTQATTVVWTRFDRAARQRDFSAAVLRAKAMQTHPRLVYAVQLSAASAGIVCKQRAHLAVEIEESKPRPLSVLMPLTARSLGEAA